MITDSQKTEILRLAGLMATARVRHTIVMAGGGKTETPEGVERRLRKTYLELASYLDTLTEQP